MKLSGGSPKQQKVRLASAADSVQLQMHSRAQASTPPPLGHHESNYNGQHFRKLTTPPPIGDIHSPSHRRLSPLPQLHPQSSSSSSSPHAQPDAQWQAIKVRPANASPLHAIIQPPPVAVPGPSYTDKDKVDIGFAMMQALLYDRQRDERQTALRGLFQKINEAFDAITQRETSGLNPMTAMHSLLMDGLDAITGMLGGMGFFFLPEKAMNDFGFSFPESDTVKQMYVFNVSALPTRNEMINKYGLNDPHFHPDKTPLFFSVLNGKVPRLFTQDDLYALQLPMTLPDGSNFVRCKLPPGHFQLDSVLLCPLHEVDLKMTVLMGLANGSYSTEILSLLAETITMFLRSVKVVVEKTRVAQQASIKAQLEVALRKFENKVRTLFRAVLQAPISDEQRRVDLLSGMSQYLTCEESVAECAFVAIVPSKGSKKEEKEEKEKKKKGSDYAASSTSSGHRTKDYMLGHITRDSTDPDEYHQQALQAILDEDSSDRLMRIATSPGPVFMSPMEVAQEFEGFVSSQPVLFVPIRVGARLTGVMIIAGSESVSAEHGVALSKVANDGFSQMEVQASAERNRSAVQAQWSIPQEFIGMVAEKTEKRDSAISSADQEFERDRDLIIEECTETFGSTAAARIEAEFSGWAKGRQGRIDITDQSPVFSGDQECQPLLNQMVAAFNRCEQKKASIRRSPVLCWYASERHPIGMLMGDLVESTHWESLLGAEGIAQLYNDLWGVFDTWVETHHPRKIIKLKTIGDCVCYLSGLSDTNDPNERDETGSAAGEVDVSDCGSDVGEQEEQQLPGEELAILVELGLGIHAMTDEVWRTWEPREFHVRRQSEFIEANPEIAEEVGQPPRSVTTQPQFRVSVTAGIDPQEALPAVRECSGRLVFDMTGSLFSLSDRMTHASSPGRGVLVTGAVRQRLDQYTSQNKGGETFGKGVEVQAELKGHGTAPKTCYFFLPKV